MDNGEKFLGDVADIRTGQTIKGPLQHQQGGDIRVLQPRDISDGKLSDDAVCVLAGTVPNLERHLLKEGDILLPNKGSRFTAFICKGLDKMDKSPFRSV